MQLHSVDSAKERFKCLWYIAGYLLFNKLITCNWIESQKKNNSNV